MQVSEPAVLGAVLAAAGLGGVWLFLSSFGRLRTRHAVAGPPTSKVRSVAMGKAELKGLAKAMGPALAAPFSGLPCVWFRWSVEEERTTTDSKGRTRKHWATIGSGASEAPFLLEDLTGVLMVEPGGAEITAPKTLSHTTGGLFNRASRPAGPMAGQWLGVGGMQPLFDRRRRLNEWRIDPQRPIYVLGVARPQPNTPGPGEGEVRYVRLTRGRNDEPFLISTDSEEELLRRLAWGAFGRMAGGTVLALGSAAVAARMFLNW